MCGKTGHIQRTYRMAKQLSGGAQHVDQTQYDDATVNYTDDEQLEPEENSDHMIFLGINRIEIPAELNELSAHMNPPKAINVFMEVNCKPITPEVDTGACVTLVSEKTWEDKLESVNLSKTSLILKTYSGETLKVLGKTEVSVKLDGQESNLPLYVVEGNGPSLLGKNWLSTVKLNWGLIKHGSSDLDQVNNKHSSLFDNSMGCLKGTQAKLNLKEGPTPKFHKVRSVPYALRETIEQELDTLV